MYGVSVNDQQRIGSLLREYAVMSRDTVNSLKLTGEQFVELNDLSVQRNKQRYTRVKIHCISKLPDNDV